LKVFDADTNSLLTPNDDITLGDYKNVITLSNTQSCLTFNPKYKSGQHFRIELLANTSIIPEPTPTDPDGGNTTAIVLCCVVAIIIIIGITVCCIKKNTEKRYVADDI